VIALDDLAAALGTGLVRVVVLPPNAGSRTDATGVGDVVLAEPGRGPVGVSGDLVVGAGIADVATAVKLVDRVGDGGAEGLVLRRRLARSRAVRTAARDRGVGLLELTDAASLVHVIGLVRGLVEQAAFGLEACDAAVQSDLFVLADAVAGLVDAPVTIEDAQSRVLAYSSRQDLTDTARVSTIVGRRVPEALVRYQRGRGVFRRLARSDEPFLVPPGPQQGRARFVVPVRAGGEWLGSIWIIVEAVPPARVVRELRQAAAVLALHLLRMRAQADLGRRMSTDRLRAWLGGTASGSSDWLPPGPWRVVALGEAREAGDADDPRAGSSDGPRGVDMWESVLRRDGWRQPLVADLDGIAYAVVQAVPPVSRPGSPPPPGTWQWLAEHVVLPATTHHTDGGMWVAAGSSVRAAADLARSRHEAAELVALHRLGVVTGATVTAEEAWAAIVLARATAGVAGDGRVPGGPVEALRLHDEANGTAYLVTLAAWLDNPREPKAAAAALGVHVNTVRNRMVRMSEVVDLDLKDQIGRLAIRLQLAALGR
jgi:hypothetical protein